MKFTRRRLIQGSGLAISAALIFSYARFFESRSLELTYTRVPIPTQKLFQSLRILHLSDFHYSDVTPLSFIQEALELGLRESPDLVLLTGDFITTGSRYVFTRYADLFKQFFSGVPTFACLGNHDGGVWSKRSGGYEDSRPVSQFLESAGIIVLNNSKASIMIKSIPIDIVGLEDLWSGNPKPVAAFGQVIQPKPLTVVLSHNPDSKSLLADFEWDLLLCGHTHGGQFVLPFVGAPIAPVVDRAYISGFNIWKGKPVYTTRGIGSLFGLRLNCAPEVTLIDLIPER